MTRPLCRHCQRNLAKLNNSRLLCYGCMMQPAIRELYPPAPNKYTRQGHGLSELTREPEPTAALPGSAEKMEQMSQRLADGEHLHHRRDAGYRKDY
jgi:hypothetical protein